MPVFKVTEKGVEKPRLIDAVSRQTAIAFVIAGRFEVEIISSASKVGKLIGSGLTLEDSTAKPADLPKVEDDKGGLTLAEDDPALEEMRQRAAQEGTNGEGGAPVVDPDAKAAVEAAATQTPRGGVKK